MFSSESYYDMSFLKKVSTFISIESCADVHIYCASSSLNASIKVWKSNFFVDTYIILKLIYIAKKFWNVFFKYLLIFYIMNIFTLPNWTIYCKLCFSYELACYESYEGNFLNCILELLFYP